MRTVGGRASAVGWQLPRAARRWDHERTRRLRDSARSEPRRVARVARHAPRRREGRLARDPQEGELLKPSVTYDEAVEEALCFGWIDSRANKMDETRVPADLLAAQAEERLGRDQQGPRRAADRRRSDDAGRPSAHRRREGRRLVGRAQPRRRPARLPDDLLGALAGESRRPSATSTRSQTHAKRIILFWVTSAKRPETRAKRIAETVALAEQNIRAAQYRPPADREKPAE